MRRLTLLLVLPFSFSCSRVPDSGKGPDLVLARQLLAQRHQPWWHGHTLPSSGEPLKVKPADSGQWASMNYSPPGTPILPIVLARALHAKAPIFADSPFSGRAIVFIDLRSAGDFYAEHIPGSRSAPVRDLDKIPADIDRTSIAIVTGLHYPHQEAVSRVRGAGFGAVYCLEGGFASWKATGYPIESRADALEYRRLAEADRDEGATDIFMGIGPLALKNLIDAGADMMIVFVGDQETYARGHIQGATRTELNGLAVAFREVSKDKLIAVYCGCCQGRAGGYSEVAARNLRAMGYTNVLHLDGHLAAWREAGYPVVTAASK